ncbi:MAG: hypothetical protein A3G84_04115 [Chloroflexi bacterium RIFCSPLOWO2_12_FULL_71_12]|nr:MAG: hypothetical protein A2082_06750 [Chloroflexi bacterium GWC2_70_10]OGO74496.1 MAG: hypothetical protein A3G84_04115 [Chloroflexi bacterium RIFCSPLOWO2_12_FULL_71_12]
MTKPRSELRNVPASVHARLLALAKSTDRDFNQVLTQYFQERLLDRLARSRYREQFALKGAVLFVALEQGSTAVRGRPTKDIDFEALELHPDPEQIRAIFAEIVALSSEPDDGVVFVTKDMQAEQIVADEEYEGVRIHVPAFLGKIRGRMQIDVGFGDAITPKPRRTPFPTLLDDYAPPQLLTYPLETVVAEKFEAAIDLAEANSRMKDFRDLYVLAVTTPFDGAVITEAVKRTFERRGTSLTPGSTVMTEGFAQDSARQSAWAGYLRKERIGTVPGSFEAVMPVILDLIGPPFRAAGEGSSFGLHWDPESRTWR